MEHEPASVRAQAVGAPGSAGRPAAARRELADFAHALISSRQNVSPRRLVAPAPDVHELELILGAAAAAPDHGLLLPWRFAIVPVERRFMLAEAFASALIDRDPEASPADVEAARAKAHRAPLLVLAIARLGPDEDGIPEIERAVSLGCAIQNMLLTTHALGFGAGLTSGQAMRSPRMKALFGLAEYEHAVCCVNIGTVSKRKPLRKKPFVSTFTTSL